MCVAYPGRVKELPDEKSALVDFQGNLVAARRGFVDIHIGDLVLVHAGCILQKVNEQDAALMNEVL